MSAAQVRGREGRTAVKAVDADGRYELGVWGRQERKYIKREVLVVPREVTARKETPAGTAKWKKLYSHFLLMAMRNYRCDALVYHISEGQTVAFSLSRYTTPQNPDQNSDVIVIPSNLISTVRG